MDQTMHAAPVELKQFEELGFFSRERVFSEEELVELRAAAEDVHLQILEAAARDDAPPVDQIDNQRYQLLCGATVKWEWRDDIPSSRSIEPTHHLDSRFDRLVDNPRLWGPCCRIIGHDELSLFSDKLNMKRPGGAPFPWHQESPYWAYGAEQLDNIVSTLTYLDDATKQNGCLWVIARSHRLGPLRGLKNRGVLGALYTDVDLLDGEASAVELPAGSVLYFHRDLVHGSQTNRSNRSRRVFVAAYQPPGLHRWRLGRKRPIKPAA